MTTEEIDELVAQAKAIMAILPITEVEFFYEDRDSWDTFTDLLWFRMVFENTKQLYDVLGMFDDRLHPHCVNETFAPVGKFLADVYLRVTDIDPDYQTKEDVWPKYKVWTYDE